MNIALLSFGTRGDVQPYVALGKALKARGHDVLLGAPDNFRTWVEGHGLPFRGLGIDMEAFLRSPEIRRVMAGNWFALARVWREKIEPMVWNLLQGTWEAGRNADTIVYHPKVTGAADVAEATGARLACAAPIPLFPTSEYPLLSPGKNFGARLNRWTYNAYYLSRPPYLKKINRWRAESLGLGKGPALLPLGGWKGGMGTRICAVSPSVVPRPHDWDERTHMTGYWFLDEGREWRPDPALRNFLDAGEPPVYVGFGSMTTPRPDRLARRIVEGARRAGVRALLATGWGGLENTDLPDTMHAIEGAPHDALFRHVRAVVHHGGAGTTAAGLRAGRPTLVCPLAVDQPFWGRRVWASGCGPKPLRIKRLNADSFARRLDDLVRNDAYRERAADVARAIAREDGVGRAVRIITGE